MEVLETESAEAIFFSQYPDVLFERRLIPLLAIHFLILLQLLAFLPLPFLSLQNQLPLSYLTRLIIVFFEQLNVRCSS